jgi:hypothetical protein
MDDLVSRTGWVLFSLLGNTLDGAPVVDDSMTSRNNDGYFTVPAREGYFA